MSIEDYRLIDGTMCSLFDECDGTKIGWTVTEDHQLEAVEDRKILALQMSGNIYMMCLAEEEDFCLMVAFEKNCIRMKSNALAKKMVKSIHSVGARSMLMEYCDRSQPYFFMEGICPPTKFLPKWMKLIESFLK